MTLISLTTFDGHPVVVVQEEIAALLPRFSAKALLGGCTIVLRSHTMHVVVAEDVKTVRDLMRRIV